MTSFKFGKASLDNLKGVHPDLVAVVRLALAYSPIDFSVVDGVRTREQQEQLIAAGKSKTFNSRHLTGHAVDVYPWVNGATSHDDAHYTPVALAMRKAAEEIGIVVEWGGEWFSFIDKPHWQLPWSTHAD